MWVSVAVSGCDNVMIDLPFSNKVDRASVTIQREPKYPFWSGLVETRTDALLAKNKRGMKKHLFRYRFVSDKDGSVLRFHNREDARQHLQLTKWHLDHAILSPDLYRERIGGLLSRIHEDWEGNDVKVRHVDQRFRRSDLESEPDSENDSEVGHAEVGHSRTRAQQRRFALGTGASTCSTTADRDDTKPKPLPFLRMYKAKPPTVTR